jgi:hypothetical protein
MPRTLLLVAAIISLVGGPVFIWFGFRARRTGHWGWQALICLGLMFLLDGAAGLLPQESHVLSEWLSGLAAIVIVVPVVAWFAKQRLLKRRARRATGAL